MWFAWLSLLAVLVEIGLGFYLTTRALKRYQRKLFEAIEPSLREHFDEINKGDGDARFYSEEEAAAILNEEYENEETPMGAIKKKLK